MDLRKGFLPLCQALSLRKWLWKIYRTSRPCLFISGVCRGRL